MNVTTVIFYWLAISFGHNAVPSLILNYNITNLYPCTCMCSYSMVNNDHPICKTCELLLFTIFYRFLILCPLMSFAPCILIFMYLFNLYDMNKELKKAHCILRAPFSSLNLILDGLRKVIARNSRVFLFNIIKN